MYCVEDLNNNLCNLTGDFHCTADKLEDIASAAGITIVWSRCRCAHGFTREETCIDCEDGWSTDGRQFFLSHERWGSSFREVLYAASTDDGCDVAYVPSRFNKRFEAYAKACTERPVQTQTQSVAKRKGKDSKVVLSPGVL